METLRVGIIGCGRPWRTEGSTGWGMSRMHARGYLAAPDVRIVALADLDEGNARAFQADIGGDRVYRDYQEMLRREEPDIVSLCTWPGLHAEMTVAAAEAGVRAIHCEKPMAPTWTEAARMAQVCAERGVQLTINHQRRFGPQFRRARDLLRAGAIGDLIRLEGSCPNLIDWGTHWFDMFFCFNDETPAEWVMGQVEPRGGRLLFGVPMEGQGLCHVRFRNGVHGLLVTSGEAGWPLHIRIIGADGIIEAADGGDTPLRLLGGGRIGWRPVPLDGPRSLAEMVEDGVLDLIDALRTGREPELSGQRALRATELIFATYESSHRPGRVDLPLTAPLASDPTTTPETE